jgi:hypothetical protein
VARPTETARGARPASARLVLLLVLGVYALACALPAVKDGDGTLPGWACLVGCWRPPLCVPWSANLLLASGVLWLGCGRYRVASWLGGAAALLGLTTWAFVDQHVGMGYYLWQASLILLALGAHMLSAKNPPLQAGSLHRETAAQVLMPQESEVSAEG